MAQGVSGGVLLKGNSGPKVRHDFGPKRRFIANIVPRDTELDLLVQAFLLDVGQDHRLPAA